MQPPLQEDIIGGLNTQDVKSLKLSSGKVWIQMYFPESHPLAQLVFLCTFCREAQWHLTYLIVFYYLFLNFFPLRLFLGHLPLSFSWIQGDHSTTVAAAPQDSFLPQILPLCCSECRWNPRCHKINRHSSWPGAQTLQRRFCGGIAGIICGRVQISESTCFGSRYQVPKYQI